MSEVVELGWREWVRLPELGIELLKAKIDTGARTSALHAFEVHIEAVGGADEVFFQMHPDQKSLDRVVQCRAPLVDTREVRDSGGHVESRHVIETTLLLGGEEKRIEVTLTDRDSMGFRMLVGRTALGKQFLVNPGKSFLLEKP